MNIRVRARLLEKTVIIDGKEREVYGLADFYTKPTRQGIGTYCILAFNNIARMDGKYCVMGFCDDKDTLNFYVRAGYCPCGIYEGKYVFSSKFITSLELTEKW